MSHHPHSSAVRLRGAAGGGWRGRLL